MSQINMSRIKTRHQDYGPNIHLYHQSPQLFTKYSLRFTKSRQILSTFALSIQYSLQNSLNSQMLRYAQHLFSTNLSINCVLYGEYVQRVQRICVVTYIACRIQTKAQSIMSEKKVISRGIELRTDRKDIRISSHQK